jgi:hypothetical protein
MVFQRQFPFIRGTNSLQNLVGSGMDVRSGLPGSQTGVLLLGTCQGARVHPAVPKILGGHEVGVRLYVDHLMIGYCSLCATGQAVSFWLV